MRAIVSISVKQNRDALCDILNGVALIAQIRAHSPASGILRLRQQQKKHCAAARFDSSHPD
jgi:hypothetical protein